MSLLSESLGKSEQMIQFVITAFLITAAFIWALAGLAISFDNFVKENEVKNEY